MPDRLQTPQRSRSESFDEIRRSWFAIHGLQLVLRCTATNAFHAQFLAEPAAKRKAMANNSLSSAQGNEPDRNKCRLTCVVMTRRAVQKHASIWVRLSWIGCSPGSGKDWPNISIARQRATS